MGLIKKGCALRLKDIKIIKEENRLKFMSEQILKLILVKLF